MPKVGPQGSADMSKLDGAKLAVSKLDVSRGAVDSLRSNVSLLEVLAQSLDRGLLDPPRSLLTHEQVEIFGTHTQGRALAAQHEARVEQAHLDVQAIRTLMLDLAAGAERFLAEFPTDEAAAGASAADMERALSGGEPPTRPVSV